MAKTHFSYACGHAGVATGNSNKRADFRAVSLAKETCWECVKAARTAVAAGAAKADGLPDLVGTPKQIAYGEAKRREAIIDFVDALSVLRFAASDEAPAIQKEVTDALTLIEDEVRAQTDAPWWIEANLTREWILSKIIGRGLAPSLKYARTA